MPMKIIASAQLGST